MPRPTDPARDLLFGLLALQTGLISQAQLVAAFHSWTQARDRPMAEILAEQGALDTPCLALVQGLVLEHLRRHGSDLERSLAAIGVGRSTRECLAQIRNLELDASLAHVGSGSTDHESDPDRTASYSVGTVTADGLRFRVLRPHARGGLGAVFVALDTELHREVALKQILDDHADDSDSRQRFLVEAEITGGLEHPGIVPVYGLGTYAGGRPFYAMRFIRGDSLKDAIVAFHDGDRLKRDPGARSLALRNLLRRFTDVCNAIEYAHSRGVLHRDLKPGNVILGKHGETLVVDWGLAKCVGRTDPGSATDERTLVPSSASGSAETLPGSALGTPAYMSPEQARGELERLGPRSDVYSLGASLYGLLTGQAPFRGDDVGAVLRAVQQGDFPAPRAVDPSIDPALEAVCVKAMATRPEDRYTSARALAEDIERWMADEPVTARPEPLAERARRWMRRRRTAVTAAAAALVVATLGLASVLIVQARANNHLQQANGLLRESVRRETKANAEVQARFDLALEAIKTFHSGVAEDVLLTNDNLKPVRDRLLADAAEFYQRLGDKLSGQADRRAQRALGQAYSEMAMLAGKIGATARAIAGHRQALAVRRELAEGAEADSEAKAEVGRSLIDLGKLLKESGRTDEARTSYEEARTLLDGLTHANPAVTQFQRDLATSYHDYGIFLSETGKPGEAMASYQAARAIQQKLADANPAVTQFQRDLGRSHINIGNLMRETGKPGEALASYEAARAIRQMLAEANPAVTEFQRDLARSHISIGLVLSATGKPGEALAAYAQARAIYEALARANPAVTGFQSDLAWIHSSIGILLYQTGKWEEALAPLKAARAIQQMLADANPTVTGFQSGLASSHNNIGDTLRKIGKPEEALASLKAARAIQQMLAEANPSITDFQSALAHSHNNIGILLQRIGKPEEALASHQAARAIQQMLAAVNPAVTGFQSRLATSHDNLGILLKQIGKPEEALASLEAARAILGKLAEANPTVTEFQIELANSQLEIGDVLRMTGQPGEARASYAGALAIIETLIKAQPAFVDGLQIFLVFGLKGLGATQQAAGQAADAVASWRRAIASDERARSSDGETLYYLAGCHARLGGITGTAGSGLTAAEGAAELDRAMGVLRRAVAAGYRPAAWMQRDPDLDPLRARPDFQLLMMDQAFPAKSSAQ
jgi:serine/threonine protein kinase/tetratricopeptide (TPR) repeat protein